LICFALQAEYKITMSTGNSILLISADAKLAEIYGRKFENDGWDVEIAESIVEGDRKLLKIRPNVIVLDADCVVDLPLEIKRLKKMPTILKTKLAIFSPFGESKQIADSINAGADLFLIKGHFTPVEMFQKIKKMLEA